MPRRRDYEDVSAEDEDEDEDYVDEGDEDEEDWCEDDEEDEDDELYASDDEEEYDVYYEELHDAAARNDVKTLKQWDKDGYCLNTKDDEGCTALHYACKNDNREAALWLIEAGARVRTRDENYRSPLHYAAKFVTAGGKQGGKGAKGDVVDALIEAGAEVDAADVHSRTPLFAAVGAQAVRNVHALLKAGATVMLEDEKGRTPLDVCARSGEGAAANTIMSMLENAARAQAKGKEYNYKYTETAATAPAACGPRNGGRCGADDDFELIEAIGGALAYLFDDDDDRSAEKKKKLQAYYEPKAAGAAGSVGASKTQAPAVAAKKAAAPTAAPAAAAPTPAPVVKKAAASVPVAPRPAAPVAPAFPPAPPAPVVASEADLAHSPLHGASAAGDVDFIFGELGRGAPVNYAVRDTGATALHVAAQRNHAHLVDYLLRCSADANARLHGTYGWTPLAFAVAARNNVTARMLMLAGANPNAVVDTPTGPVSLWALALAYEAYALLPELAAAGAVPPENAQQELQARMAQMRL